MSTPSPTRTDNTHPVLRRYPNPPAGPPIHWTNEPTTCPHCGHTNPTSFNPTSYSRICPGFG